MQGYHSDGKGQIRRLRIFFDMDYTLIAYNGTLRPRALEVLTRLREDGHEVYIWSGVGVRTSEVDGLGLLPLVSGVFQKPTDKFDEGLSTYGIPARPDVVIDDHQEVVSHFGGVLIRPYFWPNAQDKELEKVYLFICELAQNGDCSDT